MPMARVTTHRHSTARVGRVCLRTDWPPPSPRTDFPPTASPNTSGLTRTGTPVTAVMRSATVRRPTLPPVPRSLKLSRTGSWNTDGSFSFDPIGTLTEATQGRFERRSTTWDACSRARRSASMAPPWTSPGASVEMDGPPSTGATLRARSAWSPATRSERLGMAHPASSNRPPPSIRSFIGWISFLWFMGRTPASIRGSVHPAG